jgi:hypothetical protein
VVVVGGWVGEGVVVVGLRGCISGSVSNDQDHYYNFKSNYKIMGKIV